MDPFRQGRRRISPNEKLICFSHFSAEEFHDTRKHPSTLRTRRILRGISSSAPSPRILIYSPRARKTLELVRKRSGILAAGGAVDAAIHGYPQPGTIGILSAWHPIRGIPRRFPRLLSRVSRLEDRSSNGLG